MRIFPIFNKGEEKLTPEEKEKAKEMETSVEPDMQSLTIESKEDDVVDGVAIETEEK